MNRLTVIIPCYRDAATLSRALDSVYAQSRPVDEVVVVNDCSPETEAVEAVLRGYPQVSYIRNDTNVGLAATRNVGIRAAAGDIVSFLDADDELHPQKIEFQLALLRDGAVVACGVRIIRGGQSASGYPKYTEVGGVRTVADNKRLLLQNFLTGASLMASRELLLSIGGYDETLRSCEDFDLWFRLIEHEVVIVELKMPLYFYHFNPSGLSKNLQSISQWEIEVLKRHFSREGNSQHSRSLQLIVWTAWLCKHFMRAEIAGDEILRRKTLENASHLIARPLLGGLVSLFGKMRICLPVTVSLGNGSSDVGKTLNSAFDLSSVETRRAEVESSRRVLVILWLAFFAYTTSVALLFQHLVLPMLPSLHAGQGLLSQDSLYFHQMAQALAETISRDGWSVWSPWPSVNTQGNVAVLAALYALFGPNPSSVIPINACLHASSGVLLILLGRELSSGRAARWGSVVAACLFVGFPSALNWYGQVHKDGYAILGFLLLLYSGAKLLKLEHAREAAHPLIVAGAGIALTAFVRPHNLQLFEIMAVGMLILALSVFSRLSIRWAGQIAFAGMIVVAAMTIRPEIHQTETSVSALVGTEAGIEELRDWRWASSPSLPVVVDRLAEKLSNLRVFMAAYGVRERATSMIDLDVMPNSMEKFLSHLPRSVVVGVFAPFPSTWASKISPARMVGVAETLLWYAIFPGLLTSAWRRRRDPVFWWLLGCALAILTVESYVTANLGTLHRVRYPFLFILILLGTIGWAELLSKYGGKIKAVQAVPFPADRPDWKAVFSDVSTTAALAAARRGLLVAMLTVCLFIGLFARDVLLVRVLGLGADLDSYQLATLLPLFITALLAVPLGPVLIAQFMSIRQREGKEAAASWIGAMGGASLGVFVMLSLAVAGVVWFGVLGAVSESTNANVGGLMLWLLPVVALSGSVVLGNAVLVANNHAVNATLAQLAVPLICVLLILVLGAEIGAVAAAAGLMLGQLINYLLVARTSHSLGYSIRPRFGSTRWREWAGQYAPLVAVSALTSAAIPIGVYFASQLPEGSVAAFSMGSKVLQSMTALISAALFAVVLPYFSRLFVANRLLEVRRSLQLLLSLGTTISVPFAFVLFISADEIAAILFAGGRIGATEIRHLASVIQYGALQFPFYVVLAVLIKFTIAGRETLWVLVAAVLGQLANIAGASLLVERFGTAGLAMSMTLGIAVSSLLLLLWATIRQHMSWMFSALVLVSWMLFFTLAVCVHYGSVPGSIVCVLAFLALMLGELGLSRQGGFRESLSV